MKRTDIFHDIMKTDFTEQEKEIFKRRKDGHSKFKTIVIIFGLLLFIGILIDAFNGFYIFREAKSIFLGIFGLLILSLFYLVGEAVSGWIDSKDNVSHPLYKRFFHLILLLISAGIVMTLAYFTITFLGWE